MAIQRQPNNPASMNSRGQPPPSGPFAAVPNALADLKKAGMLLVALDPDASEFATAAMKATNSLGGVTTQLRGARADFQKAASAVPRAAIAKAADSSTGQLGFYSAQDRDTNISSKANEILDGITAEIIGQITAVRGEKIAGLAGTALQQIAETKTAQGDLQALKSRPDVIALSRDERDDARALGEEYATMPIDEIYSSYRNLLERLARARESGDSKRVDQLLTEERIFRVATRSILHKIKFPSGWRPGVGSVSDPGAVGAVKASEMLRAFRERRSGDAAPVLSAAAEMVQRLERIASLLFGTDVSYRGPGALSSAAFQRIMNAPATFDPTAYSASALERALFREDAIAIGPWTSVPFANLNSGRKESPR